MKIGLLALLAAAALIPLGTLVSDAAAEDMHIQASFYPYYEFTRNVAGSAAIVEQFLPLGTEAHDWEPSISKVRSLQDTDVFVYNGLGIEGYVDRLAESGDLPDVVFVKATDGLALISAAGINEMIREALAEYEDDHYTAEEAVEAIETILDSEEVRGILERYRSGELTTTEALSYIQDVVGGGHDHGDHGTTEETDEHDGHDHGDHGTTEASIREIRSIIKEIRDGDIEHEEGLEAIHDLVGSEGGHDGHDHAHDHGAFDPHVWLDPVLAVQQVANIRDALMEADPDNAETYEENAAAYVAQLDGLHNEYAEALSDCQSDAIVTFHAAFAYLVERYGFESVSLTGISGTETVSAKDIKELVDYVKANDVKYLLGEDVTDTRALGVIAEETPAEVLTLSPIEGIDAAEFEDGITYIDKMRANLEVLRTALVCQ